MGKKTPPLKTALTEKKISVAQYLLNGKKGKKIKRDNAVFFSNRRLLSTFRNSPLVPSPLRDDVDTHSKSPNNIKSLYIRLSKKLNQYIPDDKNLIMAHIKAIQHLNNAQLLTGKLDKFFSTDTTTPIENPRTIFNEIKHYFFELQNYIQNINNENVKNVLLDAHSYLYYAQNLNLDWENFEKIKKIEPLYLEMKTLLNELAESSPHSAELIIEDIQKSIKRAWSMTKNASAENDIADPLYDISASIEKLNDFFNKDTLTPFIIVFEKIMITQLGADYFDSDSSPEDDTSSTKDETDSAYETDGYMSDGEGSVLSVSEKNDTEHEHEHENDTDSAYESDGYLSDGEEPVLESVYNEMRDFLGKIKIFDFPDEATIRLFCQINDAFEHAWKQTKAGSKNVADALKELEYLIEELDNISEDNNSLPGKLMNLFENIAAAQLGESFFKEDDDFIQPKETPAPPADRPNITPHQ